MRTKRTKRRGAAIVEFALLLPLLVFLFVVGVDYARIFFYTQVIENCARNGAIYLSDPLAPANNLYSGVQQAALADAGFLNPQPTVTSSSGTDSAGNPYVTATVSWTFNTVSGYPGVPNAVNVSRTVQMRQAP